MGHAKKNTIELEPAVRAAYERAFQLLKDNKPAEAITVCSAPALMPLCGTLGLPNYLLGKAYYLKGDSKGDAFASLYFLEKALEMGAENDEVHAMLAVLYFRLRRFELSRKAFGHYMSEGVTDAASWLTYGLAALLDGQPGEAETALARAAALRPDGWEGPFLLACAIGRAGRGGEAQGALDRALALAGPHMREQLPGVFARAVAAAGGEELYDVLLQAAVFQYAIRPDARARTVETPKALSGEYGTVEQPKDFDWIRQNIPCQAACPALTDVPGYIGAIAVGDTQKAYQINRHYNLLPGVLGRVCSRPCESACRHGFEGNGDPVGICFLKRVADDFGTPGTLRREKIFGPTGKKVAVVGSGPAGLTVANDLALLGHEVTIFEAYHTPGGMLVQGIPVFRLPREVVAREIAQITDLGVNIRCGIRIGDDLPIPDLLRDFDCAILAAGTLKPNVPDTPGGQLAGIVHGLHFMERVNKSLAFETGRNVVVIGGGFTAFDCVRSAFRLGADNSHIYYRRTKAEMLVTREEIIECEREGIQIHELVAPVEYLGRDGRVTAVRLVRNRLGEPDASGRRRPVPVPGSEFEVPADTVLLATGQSPDYAAVERAFGSGLLEKGWLTLDPETHLTRVERLFATGDFITGASTIIEAVGMARRTANKVDTFLMGRRRRKSVVRIEPANETGRIREDDAIPLQHMPVVDLKRRRDMTVEVETGYKRDVAHREAKRCYLCHYKFEIEMDKCIYCDLCIKAKPDHLKCIKKVAGFTLDERGVVTGVREATHSDETLAIWIDGHECIRCGQCLRACPTDAISLKRVSLDETTAEPGEKGVFFLELSKVTGR